MKTWWLILQVFICIHLWYPALLLFVAAIRKRFSGIKKPQNQSRETDIAVIVTAYQQFDLVDDVVFSVLNNNYSNYIIYVVADNCDIDNIQYKSDKVILLRPETVLGSNTRSHFYAIDHFLRKHEVLTIIDSDNIVQKNYLCHLNKLFNSGYNAVQGVRSARNLNTQYARLDEAGDIYYRFVDRKLLFEAGSSASLAGSGMAFRTDLFIDCLHQFNKSGAGFDKFLQYELVRRNERIAFSEDAVVYDGKTSKPDQLVKQRARWINTWFRYWILGLKLFFQSLFTFNWNQFAFSLMLLRPPLFILMFGTLIFIIINLIISPASLIVWGIALFTFVAVAFRSLGHFKAPDSIYKSLANIPNFIYYQVVALFKARVANKLSVATKHDVEEYKKNN